MATATFLNSNSNEFVQNALVSHKQSIIADLPGASDEDTRSPKLAAFVTCILRKPPLVLEIAIRSLFADQILFLKMPWR